MATAIELYRKAYDLDYRKGDWQQAEELYKQIIEKYPYSDEKEYALVHIERIENLRANPHDQKLQPVRAEGCAVNGFNVVNFVLILMLAVGIAAMGYVAWQQAKYLEYNSLLLQGALSEKVDNYDHAGILYKQAQEILPAHGLAYRFLAELYLRMGQYGLADIERKRWALGSPDDQGLGEFSLRLHNALENQAREEQ